MTATERVIYALFCETLDTVGDEVDELRPIFDLAKAEGLDVLNIVDLVEKARFDRDAA